MAQELRAEDIMTQAATCVGAHQSLHEAARMMRDLGVGALPICGDNNRLTGMVTDRDIVVTCCAEGVDPATVQAGTLAGELHWTDTGASASEVLRIMEEHHVKRLPVIDVNSGHRLVGMITEANLARNLSDAQIAEFAAAVYAQA
ncbi:MULTISPECIES: CBS domain-containing protein [unclassified Streptomyces]|uniref:CBS domain-containing protein n=1 Tax=unclassified Streptomyces TaxID=2593676 RepID=UPI003446612A